MDVRKLEVGAAAMSTPEEEEALVGKDIMLKLYFGNMAH